MRLLLDVILQKLSTLFLGSLALMYKLQGIALKKWNLNLIKHYSCLVSLVGANPWLNNVESEGLACRRDFRSEQNANEVWSVSLVNKIA